VVAGSAASPTAAPAVHGPAALPLLAPARNDADAEVSRRAEQIVREIRQLSDAAVPGAVLRELARRRPDGAVAAVLSYAPFADDEAVEDEALAALAALAAGRWEAAGPELLRALRDPLPARRRAAAYVLGRSPTRLPNGNTLISNHSERRVIEVAPDGKVVGEIQDDACVWRAHRH
jgi:hypothetical protein